MEKYRTAKAAAAYFRDRDPDSTITEYMLRNLMDLGELPYIEVGHKRVTSIETIERMLAEKLGGEANA